MQAEKARILLVEDDRSLASVIRDYLSISGYQVTLCDDGQAAINTFKKSKFDLCILDVMMPKKDGFTVAEEIRKDDKEVPIIFLTAKSLKEDKIKGLTLGADDYITKPFSMEILELKMNAILRRTEKHEVQAALDEYKAGDCVLDYKNHKLKVKDSEIKLTTKENELLRLFFEKKNQILERELALKHVWQDDSYFTARSMDVFISKIRKYLKEDERLQILNIHGQGYKLVENEMA